MLLSRFAGRAFEQPAGALDARSPPRPKRHEVLIRCSRFCPHCLRENGAWLLALAASAGASSASLTACCCSAAARTAARSPKAVLREQLAQRPRRRPVRSDPLRASLERELCRGRARERRHAERRATRRSLRNAGSTRCSTASPTRHSPACSSSRRSTSATCSRSATCFTATRSRPRKRPSPSRLGAPAVTTIRRSSRRCCPKRSRSPTSPTADALADALRELADERYRNDGLTLLASKTGPMSEHAHAPCCGTRSARRSGRARPGSWDFTPARTAAPTTSTSDCNHGTSHNCSGPRTMTREIAELFDFDDFTHWLGRRFCSVLLARMLTPLDWDAAVRYLDFPERFINKGYNTTFTKLRANRSLRRARRPRETDRQPARRARADRLQAAPRQARRLGRHRHRQLASAATPPRPLSAAGAAWTSRSRRAQASLWLWCHLTSGHERAAPIPMPTTRGLSDQTQFIRDALPTLRERLLILGELLLTTPAEARSTLPNRPRRSATPARTPRPRTTTCDTIDPLITTACLAHVGAHTGVDIPSLTTPSVGSHAPPAVTHARLLAARLLRCTALASFTAIAAAIGGDGNHLADNDRRYRPPLTRNATPRRRTQPTRPRRRELAQRPRRAPPTHAAPPAHARDRDRDQSRLRRAARPPPTGAHGALHQHPALPPAHGSHLLRDRRHPQRQRRPAQLLARHRRPPLPRRPRLRPAIPSNSSEPPGSCNDKPATHNANLKRGLTSGRAT